METFDFIAAGAAGAEVRGVLSAADELALDRALEKKGLLLKHASVVDARGSRSRARFTRDELVTFTTQLATVTGAGIPIIEGLQGIGKRLASPPARELVERLVVSLEAGGSLSEAMAPFPRVFPPIYRASVRAGEASGALDAILQRLAKFLEWSRAMRATAVQALIYPAILFCAILGLIALLLLFVLPKIMGLFPDGAELPWQTEVVLTASNALRGCWFLVAGAAVGVAFGAVAAWRVPRVKRAVFAGLLQVPKLGPLMQKLAMSRFASTASTLHGAGCDVFTMLEIASESCGNAALEAAFARATTRIRKGSSISAAFEQEPLLDPLLCQMIHVGEQAGALDMALAKVAEYYDDEIPRAVKKFLSLLEPCILLGAGGVVAFILMAAVMPLFQLYENIG